MHVCALHGDTMVSIKKTSFNLNPTGGDSQYISTGVEVISDSHQPLLCSFPHPSPHIFPQKKAVASKGEGMRQIRDKYILHTLRLFWAGLATGSTPRFDTPPGLVRHATVLVVIPTDNMERGKGAILLMEQILAGLFRIQITLPSSFGVYSYLDRSDLTHTFRH